MAEDNNQGNGLPHIEILPDPTKSESDQKLYRLIKLTNGLKALLISDPRPQDPKVDTDSDDSDSESDTTDKESSEDSSLRSHPNSDDEGNENSETLAAAALTVDVGSFSDPRDIQGLAHFLEHMIFMGSEKYPLENEFDSYIKKGGGSDNADTDCEETNYYFEISEEYLDGALDRFAQLFTAPKLQSDTMTREREAVESEFVSKMQGDSVRRDQLIAEMANTDHPCSIFTWGNLKTLKENVSEELLYEKVNEFRKRHYSAHRMYLAVQARLSLDELEDLVVKNFSNIPNNNLPALNFSNLSHENVFKDDFKNKVYYVKPVASIVKLELTWCIPSYVYNYRCKPHHFISYIMGYEGSGSLCCYLRKKLWALDVTTGIEESGFEHNSLYSLFTITIYLTDEGYNFIDSVLAATFSFIKVLNDEDLRERFNELKLIEDTSFRFQTEQDSIDNVEQLVLNLKYYAPIDTLTGPSILFEYNEMEIKTFINHLNTFGFNVMITKKKQPGIVFDLKERWFGTEYATKDFPNKWRDLWNECEKIPELFLSKPNEFIPTNFEILKSLTPPPQFPEKIFSTDCSELWYGQDDKFKRPKAFMYFYFLSPLPKHSARNATLNNLYSLILKHHFGEHLYSAVVAGLNHDCYATENGFVVKINGFSEKLHLLVDIITKHMIEFNQTIIHGEFNTFQTELSKEFYNSIIKPKSLNKELRLSIIESSRWSIIEKYNALKGVTYENLTEFAENFVQEFKITALIQGNVTKEQSIDVMKNILNKIQCNKIESLESIAPRTVELPLGSNFIRVKSANLKDVNTVITNFYQVGPSTIRLSSLLDLLAMLIEEPLFDILRTKEQLAYDVSCSIRSNNRIYGYSITVNSQENKFTANDIELRMEKFRIEYLEILKSMTETDFEQTKESLIKLNQIADRKLKDEVLRNWSEIINDEFLFDRREKAVIYLKTVTHKEFIEFYEGLITDPNFNRKLSVQVIGNKKKKSSKNVKKANSNSNGMPAHFNLEILPDVSRNFITDIKLFKSGLSVYPCTKTKL